MNAARADLPERFANVEELEAFLSRPTPDLVADLATVDGDILILGVGGKMGPTLARLARNAAPGRRVIGVARFSTPALRESLAAHGVETIAADLLDRSALERLPRVRNVIFMAGRKFGAVGNQPLTWAVNGYLPGLVAEAFRDARIVAFSTGCVYAFVDVTSGSNSAARSGCSDLSAARPSSASIWKRSRSTAAASISST